MRHLERILRALFWLPIFLGGTVAFSLVDPRFHKFGVISVALLIVFVVLLLLLAALERRAFARSRNEQTAAVARKP
jgi:hypothetical protein